jgi:Ca2+-binding EF-hand superfamily protein
MLPTLALAAAFAAFAAPPPAPPTHGLGVRSFGPRADLFIPGTRPHFLDQAALTGPPFRRTEAAKVADTFELVFLTRTRPVRVRVVAHVAGMTLNERFEKHLKEMFQVADRDGDGVLNKYECELIYSKTEFRSMLAGGFAFRGQSGALPSLEVIDRDDDGRVTFEEFAEYYTPELTRLTQIRPINSGSAADPYTAQLFARLDANKDGKLTEAELKEGEKLLPTLDTDEDETVSGAELLANAIGPTRLGGTDGGAMMGDNMMGGMIGGRNPLRANDDVQVHLGGVPGTVIQAVLKRYDENGDYDLSAKEISFDKTAFDALDADKNGKLSATELEAWRTGQPDAIVTLTVGDQQAECRATAKVLGGGVTLPKQPSADRVVLHVDKQTLDLAALPTPDYARTRNNPYGYLFPADKKFLTEKDLVGPQYQFLRVAFDPADLDGDGKLTRAEFDRYFALQQKTGLLGLSLTHTVRVPNLFALLDGNGDGRLGVKELRTAFARLQPLEPSGGAEVTRAILQPSASVRLGNSFYGTDANGAAVTADPLTLGRMNPPTAGPVWFHKMDRNGDGDVSRGEFLGAKAEFAKLDTNADGLISLEEAEAFEAKARPKK